MPIKRFCPHCESPLKVTAGMEPAERGRRRKKTYFFSCPTCLAEYKWERENGFFLKSQIEDMDLCHIFDRTRLGEGAWTEDWSWQEF